MDTRSDSQSELMETENYSRHPSAAEEQPLANINARNEDHVMSETLALWEAAKREMEEYQFAAEAEVQPKWDVPEKIAINAAISSRFGDGKQSKPMSIEDYVDAASSVIEAGACGVHIDFSWITDDKGRRLDRDVPPVEAYSELSWSRCGRALATTLSSTSTFFMG